MKKAKKNTPRFGPLAIAQILLLRSQGKTFRAIAKAPFVRKKNGKRPSQQAVWEVCKTKVLKKRQGTWAPKQGSGKGGGRPEELTDAQKAKVVSTLKKHRFKRVRAPWITRKLNLTCSVRTVRRVINNAGYRLPKLTNRRVLTAPTKAKRVAWAEARRQDLAWPKRVHSFISDCFQ